MTTAIGHPKDKTRSDCNARWIAKHCIAPIGPGRGEPAMLTSEQRYVIRGVYERDHAELLIQDHVLASYLALLHTCGPEARGQFRPKLRVDPVVVWAAAGPDLRAVLERDGVDIVCPELGTRYPPATAVSAP